MTDRKQKNADIIAVARAARVSPSTVSRSFNHPKLVKPETRKKIDKAVRKLGYIRNRAAQTIHGIRSGTIGLIVPTIDQAIFAELIESFSNAVEELGFTILLASHGYSLEREYALTRKMLEHRVDGVGLIGTEHSRDTYDLLKQQDVPALLLWNYVQDAPFACVGSDNWRAGYLIGQHVAALGHEKIAAIFPPLSGNDRASNRMIGVRAGLAEAGRAIMPEWQVETPYSVGSAKAATQMLLQGDERPTCIIGGNDVLAWGALHALSCGGLDVPTHMTVTGIGDFQGSKDFEPALTTVRIPARAIGRQAAKAMVDLITSDADRDVSALIKPELLIRSTSGPPV